MYGLVSISCYAIDYIVLVDELRDCLTTTHSHSYN
jgi:hypothetical protein